jgi:hypothetical protein
MRTIFLAGFEGSVPEHGSFLQEERVTASAVRIYVILLEVALPDLEEIPDFAPSR